jgi:predicted ABC-type ATPase
MLNNQYELSAEVHEKIFQELLFKILAKSDTQDHPVIVILGGQPGSGKSRLIQIAQENVFYNRQAVVINGDDYRAAHPQAWNIYKQHDKTYAEMTDWDVRKWTTKLLEMTVKEKRNIILETTMRNKEPLMNTIRLLKEKRYMVGAYIMAVNEQISKIGIVQRYENQKAKKGIARWTAFDVHDEAYKNMPETVSAIEYGSPIDFLGVFNRSGDILYFNEKTNGIFIYPENGEDAKFSIIKERNRHLTFQEQTQLRQAIKKIQKQMDNRGAGKDFNIISNILYNNELTR